MKSSSKGSESKSKPEGWRSRSKKGSISEERRSAREHTLGKPGRNSGRGKFEKYDASIGGRDKVVNLEYDLKQTHASSYRVAHGQMKVGEKLCASSGQRFALQIQFMENKEVVGDYMVVATDVFEDLVKLAHAKASIQSTGRGED